MPLGQVLVSRELLMKTSSFVLGLQGLIVQCRLLTHDSACHHREASSTTVYGRLPKIGKSSSSTNNTT